MRDVSNKHHNTFIYSTLSLSFFAFTIIHYFQHLPTAVYIECIHSISRTSQQSQLVIVSDVGRWYIYAWWRHTWMHQISNCDVGRWDIYAWWGHAVM